MGVGESMVKGYRVSVMQDTEVQGDLLYSIVSSANNTELYATILNCILKIF